MLDIKKMLANLEEYKTKLKNKKFDLDFSDISFNNFAVVSASSIPNGWILSFWVGGLPISLNAWWT